MAKDKRIMAMNPETNRMEPVLGRLIAEHWSTYSVDEVVEVYGYLWRVAHIGESHLLLEPVGRCWSTTVRRWRRPDLFDPSA